MKTDGQIKVFHSFAKPRKGAFRNHRHSAYEISLIVSGSGNYRVRDTDYRIESGNVFLYHSNEPHCITDIAEDEPMHILNIQFEPRYFWQSSDFTASDCLQTFLQRSFRNENRLENGSELCEIIKPLIYKADSEFENKAFGAEQLLKQAVFEILIILSRAEESIPKKVHDTERAIRIGNSMDYITENLTSELTLENIAREAGMSRTYYSAAFKTLNGISPWEYICIKRIDFAMKLLRENSSNILDIALLSGFNNTANFNKIFKRITGITPKEYRCYKKSHL